MEYKLIFFIVMQLVYINSFQFELLNEINSIPDIGNEIYDNFNYQKILNKILFDDEDWDFIMEIMNFIKENTNITQAKKFDDFYDCVYSILNESTDDTHNYLNVLALSGKDLSDFGLEDECLRTNFSYYLITYEFMRGASVRRKLLNNSFMFFQQNTFYTGICLPRICHSFLTFLFNQTVDPAFYSFMRKNLDVRNARVYSVRNVDKENNNKDKDPTETFDMDGKYNIKKTQNEKNKQILFTIIIYIVLFILSIQFIIGILIHICYNPIANVQKLREEKIEESKDESEDSEEESSSRQLFGEIKLKKDEEIDKNCCEKCCEFLFKYFSMFDNIKYLSEKKNKFFDGFNLEIITYLRIITMILMTFINNFEALIKIPSRYFFYESFYTQFSTVYLKFASFSVDIWLCLDGFETMYKLISYYKKYKLNKEGKKKNFFYLLKFYLYSAYKFASFLIFFIIVNYTTKYFIYSISNGALFDYYANHIYNDRLDDEKLFKFLIPGYSLYYFYYIKCSIFENIFISKYSLIFINEFYAYTLLILIFYLSILFKMQIFDYIIILLNFGAYFANFWIIEFKSNEEVYYSYQLVFDNFITTRYPHIVFNFFFLGALAGLICFYDKDISSSNSICNDNKKIPFKFCYHAIKFFDYLIEKGRKFWVFFLILIQILISLSFYFLVKINGNTIFIPFNNLQKFVLSYESGLFVFLFCNIIILIIFIRRQNEGKEKNYSSFLIIIDRTSFSFYHTINLIMYTFYCFFDFQVKLNIQNLFIVAFAFFFIVFFANLIFTLAFVFPFKILNRKVIDYILIEKTRIRRDSISQASIILEKSTIRDTIDSNIKDS